MKIAEELLTLHCPECGMAFIDFTNCFALWCGLCDCAFCAYCQKSCRRERNDYERTLQVPFACIPIVVAVSLALATLLFHCVEEPCRRLLRSTRGGAATATATGRSADDAAAKAANAAAKAKQEEFAAVDRTSSLLGAPLLGDGQGRT